MRPSLAVLAAIFLTAPCTALAGSASVTIAINAHVDTFCQINAPQQSQINIVNGQADIGTVREICNTPSGYNVSAQFSNLSGGQLNVAGLGYAIDSTGLSVRHSNQAHVQSVDWQLTNAQLSQPGAPVVMQVTITPI